VTTANGTMGVVWAADDDYVRPMLASLRSFLRHSEDATSVAILGCGLSPRSKRLIAETCDSANVNAHVIDVDDVLLSGLPTAEQTGGELLSTAGYARLYLAELLPDDWRRVVYLDADTLVRGSLRELFTLPLQGCTVAAVQEPYCPFVSSDAGLRNWRELGLARDTPYFNSGVMVIDMDEWRGSALGRSAVEYARAHADILFQHDQEALNARLAGRWLPLDTVWNVTSYWRRPERHTGRHVGILERARIRHFTGAFKPWRPDGATQPHADEFLGYWP
jgi:lipopolysaccharide biosynthesis glycosyltransferase